MDIIKTFDSPVAKLLSRKVKFKEYYPDLKERMALKENP
jgi:hypothetical protein